MTGDPRPMLGDIVRPRQGCLSSGCQRFDDAVVVRVSPFALVSRGADMLWSCSVERDELEVTGRATLGMFEACRQRITYGLTNRRVKRERSKARRRLAGEVSHG